MCLDPARFVYCAVYMTDLQFATVKLGLLKKTGKSGEDRGVIEVAIKIPRINESLKDISNDMLKEAMLMSSVYCTWVTVTIIYSTIIATSCA